METSPVKATGRAELANPEPAVLGTILVHQSIEEVFDYLADGTHDSAWQSWVSRSELLRYGGGVGAIYRQSLHDTSLGGRDFRYRVVHHRRPLLIGVEALGPLGHPRASFRLESVGPSTTGIALSVDLSGVGWPGPGTAGALRWRDRLVTSLPHLQSCLDQLVGQPGRL
ncbi:MAG: SRPBCC family protein [Candidatus Dormiibacterota bacterium]